MDHFGDLDIVAAILGDFHHRFWAASAFVFLPPFEGIESVGGFSGAERCRGNGVEFETVAEHFFDFDEHVEIAGLLENVEHGIGLEYAVVEADVIVADDQISADEFVDEILHLAFLVDAVLFGCRGVGDRYRNAHFVFLGKAADIAEAALGFEVKINDVRHARAS